MSKEIAIKEEVNFDTMLMDIENMQKMANKLMQSKHYQAMGEAGVFAIIQRAKALGISPLDALNGGIYYVSGKTGMSSELMASLIRRAGHSITKDSKSTQTNCILNGRRCDNGDTWTVSFSMEDAKRAQIDKNMWLKYPSVMCYNRALSMLARQLFPDVIKGSGYTMDELQEIKDNKNYQTLDAEIIQETSEKEIVYATDDQIIDLLAALKRCPDDYSEKVRTYLNGKGLSDNKLPIDLYVQASEGASKKAQEHLKSVSEGESEEN